MRETQHSSAKNGEHGFRDGRSAAGTHRQPRLHAWEILKTFVCSGNICMLLMAFESHRKRPQSSGAATAAAKGRRQQINVPDGDLCCWRWTFSSDAGQWPFHKIPTLYRHRRLRLHACMVRVCGCLRNRLYLAVGNGFSFLPVAAMTRVVSVSEMQNGIMVTCEMDWEMNMRNYRFCAQISQNTNIQ